MGSNPIGDAIKLPKFHLDSLGDPSVSGSY